MSKNFGITIVKVEGESIFMVNEIYSAEYKSIEEHIDNKIEIGLGYLDLKEVRQIEGIKTTDSNIYLIVSENERSSQIFNILNCELCITGIMDKGKLSAAINKDLTESQQAIIDYLKREYDMVALIKKINKNFKND
jgi:hypothetical protein